MEAILGRIDTWKMEEANHTTYAEKGTTSNDIDITFTDKINNIDIGINMRADTGALEMGHEAFNTNMDDFERMQGRLLSDLKAIYAYFRTNEKLTR
jgi:cytolysin (calcineurin-like family phosphatase)